MNRRCDEPMRATMLRFATTLPLALSLFLLAGCGATAGEAEPEPPATDSTTAAAVKTGAQVLTDESFERLRGQRVGLVVNHTARVDTAHLIDVVDRTEGVTLGALFGPEHGLRGTVAAGEKVADGRDAQTGVPVYSLYGASRKPSPEALEGLDALVFDVQDVGARFYTYIATMGLAMQASAEAGLPFVVLDRPNPLGGVYASGFVLEPAYESFVGPYPIPVAHGMTVGEIARMIQGEGWLPGLEALDLRVVEMEGWRRAMQWPATDLPWIAPSPNIPTVETALVYAGACFFEATSASEGRGTEAPFVLLGAPWADGRALADTLNARSLPGVHFEAATFTPRDIAGAAVDPKHEGEKTHGIRHVVTDAEAFRPVETGIHTLHAFYEAARREGIADFIARPEWLDKLAGTDRLRLMLTEGARADAIIAVWEDEVAAFEERRAAHLLYE